MVISYKLGLGWRLAGKVTISYSILRNLHLVQRLIFRTASVWFYCKLDRERKVWDKIHSGGPPVLGTFTGYFHFVPDQKSRLKDVFDPGPLQLEVVGVSDLATNAKPNTFRPVTPHN
jgi:hypothetical protein